MGQYSITAGTFGKALAVTPVAIGALDPRSAWEFENQSATLGNNYTGSQLYVGGTGNVDVILEGVTGAQDTVTGFNFEPIFTGANPFYAGFTAGSGYFTENNVATTVVSSVYKSPANQPAGLTVNIIADLPGVNLTEAGSGYTAGNAFTTTVTPAGGTGLVGTIDSITGGGGTGPIATFTITRGGAGYSAGDVATIVSAGGTGAELTIVVARNGAVTLASFKFPKIQDAGSNYSVGDIITVDQTGHVEDCKFVVSSVESLLPGVNDVVRFTAVPVGTILPAAVSYVIDSGDATGLVALK
jgi:hypothetical protein